MPIVMLMGNVTARAIGRNNPGSACGTVIFMAAGTAIYEALAANTPKTNLLAISSVTRELSTAKMDPLINGTTMAKMNGNQPKAKNDFNFLPLVMPISNKKMAKNPLNKSLVNGLIPSACFVLAKNPMTKLPNISNTLPLVKECAMTDPVFILFS